MREEQKDYSTNLNLDFNNKEFKTQETNEDINEKYNPPDINKIKVEEKKENIYEGKEDKEDKEENMKRFFEETGLIELIIDKIDILRKGKEKIMDLFAELKKKRGPKGYVTYEEKLLYTKILYLYRDQLKIDKEKKDKEESNDLYSGSDKNLDDINKKNDEEIQVNDVFEILKNVKLSDVDIKYLTPKKEDNLIISDNKINNDNCNDNDNDNIDIFSNKLNKNIEGFNNPSFQRKRINSLGDCFRGMFNICFKKTNICYYEGLNLHMSIAIIIFQNLFYLSTFIGQIRTEFEIPLPSIYMMIVIATDCIFIFYKLFFKRYYESFTKRTCCIVLHLIFFFLFKSFIYFILFLILKDVIENEEPNKIFIAFLSIKIVYLLYFSIYFFVRDGLIHYGFLTIFGIMIMCISVLISLFFFSLKDVIILFIICSVEMFFFHLGINIARYKKCLQEKKLWNTLNIEFFEWTIILFPAMIGTFFVLTIATFGIFYFVMKDSC